MARTPRTPCQFLSQPLNLCGPFGWKQRFHWIRHHLRLQSLQSSLGVRDVRFDRGAHFVDLGKMGSEQKLFSFLHLNVDWCLLPSSALWHAPTLNTTCRPLVLRCRPTLSMPAPTLTPSAWQLPPWQLDPGIGFHPEVFWHGVTTFFGCSSFGGVPDCETAEDLLVATALMGATTLQHAQPRLVLEIFVGAPPTTIATLLPTSRLWHHPP